MAGREHIENEIKLLSVDRNSRLSYGTDPGNAINMLLKLFDGLGIKHGKVSFGEQTDRYYDDEDGTLFRMRSGIRVRKKNGTAEITLKTPSSGTKSSIGSVRNEKEYDIADGDDAAEKMQSILTDANLGRVMISKEPVVEVRTARHKIIIEADGRESEFCLDKIRFFKDGAESAPQYEIEVESSDRVDTPKIKELTDSLISEFGFVISGKSKYERGRDWVLNWSW